MFEKIHGNKNIEVLYLTDNGVSSVDCLFRNLDDTCDTIMKKNSHKAFIAAIRVDEKNICGEYMEMIGRFYPTRYED